jgi:hypothetical protein
MWMPLPVRFPPLGGPIEAQWLQARRQHAQHDAGNSLLTSRDHGGQGHALQPTQSQSYCAPCSPHRRSSLLDTCSFAVDEFSGASGTTGPLMGGGAAMGDSNPASQALEARAASASAAATAAASPPASRSAPLSGHCRHGIRHAWRIALDGCAANNDPIDFLPVASPSRCRASPACCARR